MRKDGVERTLVLLKPDAIQRGLIGDIISRFEHKGLKIVGLKLMWLDKERASRHYAHHKDKPFFKNLLSYITSGPLVTMVVEGLNAVEAVRKLVGATDPHEALPGTIRHDFGMHVGRNLIHASDSKESAEKEITMFFDIDEIVEYKRMDEEWLYER